MLALNISGKLLTLLGIFLIGSSSKAARTIQNVRLIITSLKYDVPDNTPLKFEYSILPAKYDSIMANLNFTFSEDVYALIAKGKVFYVRNGKRYNYMDIELDLCKEIVRAQSNIFLKAIAAAIRQCSNAPFECPFKKNLMYTLQNVSLYDTPMPPYLPEMDFELYGGVWLKGTMLYNLSASGKLIKTQDKRRVIAMQC